MKLKAVFGAALVILTLAGCGGGGGGGGGNDGGGDPGPLPGVYILDTAGGSGAPGGGTGGDGGAVTVVKEAGSGGVALLRSGEADASFSPLALMVSLGSNPLVVTADTEVVFSVSEPPAGTPYLMTFNNPRLNLFVSDGDGTLGDELPVTGISVAAGATLTFGANAATGASVVLANDIENHGTVATADLNASQRGSLEITFGSYLGGGIVTTAGELEGQSGGSLYLYAGGSVANRGPIDTRGAANAAGSGGNGGDIEIYADDRFENTAEIHSGGGSATGSTGNGGNGGYVDLMGTNGFNNSGAIACTGGNGRTGGGNGGWVWFEVYSAGDLRNSGAVNSSGGISAAGPGGNGGEMDIYAYGGDLIQAGSLSAAGGAATGGSGNGGAGGYLILGVFSGYGVPVPAGDLVASGHLTTAGGQSAGGSGGSGGSIDFYIGNFDAADASLEGGQNLKLVNYKLLDTRGGGGNFGGSGGAVDLIADSGFLNPANLVNDVEILTRGGAATPQGAVIPAHGGKGGDVFLAAYAGTGNAANPLGSKVANSGRIDASGGENREFDGTFWWGGAGGEIQLTGTDGLINSGALVASGGRDTGTDRGASGFGGLGNWIVLTSGKGLSNTGSLEAGGGYGEYQGGDAGEVHLVGRTAVDSRGTIRATGGSADPALSGSWGGDGGFVQVEVTETSGSYTHTASVAVDGGNGTTRGLDGQVMLSR